MAADILSPFCSVEIFEKGKTVGRKFLVAGNGGFNITNSATGNALINKFSPAGFFSNAISAFDSDATRSWLLQMGIPTYIGSSGRVFPETGIKPIEVLQKIKEKLIMQNVQFHFDHEFISFNSENRPVFKYQENEIVPIADYYIFALGGASWSITGSNEVWRAEFEKIGIKTIPFQSSNCGVNIEWTENFKSKYAGAPLKNISISINDFTIKGEALITHYGLEGNAVYPIIAEVRKMISKNVASFIHIDFKPTNSNVQLKNKISGLTVPTKNYKTVFNLNEVQLALIKQFTSKEFFIQPESFISSIKNLSIPISSLRPIEESISTVGGIALDEMNDNFSLKKFPSIYIVGEMLDWDAPTGGYLLQGCFSTAYYAATNILNSLSIKN